MLFVLHFYTLRSACCARSVFVMRCGVGWGKGLRWVPQVVGRSVGKTSSVVGDLSPAFFLPKKNDDILPRLFPSFSLEPAARQKKNKARKVNDHHEFIAASIIPLYCSLKATVMASQRFTNATAFSLVSRRKLRTSLM